MAQNQILTVQDIMDSVHVAYEQATDTPALTDDDGIIRMNLINKGIERWQYENGVRWRELDVLNVNAGVISAGTVTYSIGITDFRELGSKIRVLATNGTVSYITIVSLEYFRNYINGNGLVQGFNSTNVACISGNNRTGYQINLGFVPVANDNFVGGTMYFDYYKYADKMSRMADVPEMSNPAALIDYVTAELFVNDDVNLYTKFNSDWLNDLSNMRDENEKMPAFASNALENQGYADSIVMGV